MFALSWYLLSCSRSHMQSKALNWQISFNAIIHYHASYAGILCCVINCHGVNEGEELFQEKRLNSQAKYCWSLNYLDWARSKGGSVDVKKNRPWLLFVFIRRLANLRCFVDTLVGSIVQDTRRKKCFQCQGGRKATGEWRDLLLCRYAMQEWVPMQGSLGWGPIFEERYFCCTETFAVYIFIQIKYYYTQLHNWWRQNAQVARLVGYTTNFSVNMIISEACA